MSLLSRFHALGVAPKTIGHEIKAVYLTCCSCDKSATTKGKIAILICTNCTMSMKITSRNRQWFLKIYIQDSFIPETKIKLAVFHNEVKKLFLICDIHDTASEDEVLENLNDTQSKKLIDIEKLII